MAFKLKQRPLLKILAALVGATALLHGSGASAIGLMQAYEAAVKNDPTFRAAYYNNEAGKENRKLGLSNLLPNLSASSSVSQNRTTLTRGTLETPEDYLSRSNILQLRQTLFNLDAWARFKQGSAQSKYSEAQFASQQQEVIVRVVTAYCDVLYKQDLLALSKVERDTYVEQNKVNENLFRRGEGTRTDMLETQARLDAAEAQVLEATDNLNNSRDALGAIVGGDVGEIDPLAPGFTVRPADSVSYEAWKAIALERNPDIQTLRYGVEIAGQEVLKQRAGHAPRIDFVGTYGKTASDSINTVNTDQNIRSIGIQVNIPLYSGGAVSAQSRQAVATQEKAKVDLQAQIDKILIELHKDHSALVSSVARINALGKSVDSATLLITATEQSVRGGVRINLDVLNAKQQLYASKRDLAQARYNYLLTSLRMRAAVGTLTSDDVREMAPYFR